MPGSIVELGVFRGTSLFHTSLHFLANIRSAIRPFRKAIGFDSFEGLSDFSSRDGAEDKAHAKQAGGWSASSYESELREMMELFGIESFVPQAPRIEIIKGNILEKVPEYVAQNPGLEMCCSISTVISMSRRWRALSIWFL